MPYEEPRLFEPTPVLDPTTLQRIKAALLARMGQPGTPPMNLQMMRAPQINPELPLQSGPPLLGLRMAPALNSSGLNGLDPMSTPRYFPGR